MSTNNATDAELLAHLIGEDKANELLAHKELLEIFGYQQTHESSVGEAVVPYQPLDALVAAKELIARCMQQRLKKDRLMVGRQEDVKSFLVQKLGALQHEEFWALWLDAQHRLIHAERLFVGTLTETAVYPREVVKQALHLNAAAVIVAHNHPSGITEPSRSDESLTRTLLDAMRSIQVRLLDHFIVGGSCTTSFAERGLL